MQKNPEKTGFFMRLESFLASKPLPVILISIILTLIFGYFTAKHTRIDNDVQTMIPKNNPVKLMENEYSRIFGQAGGIVLALEDSRGILNLEALKQIQILSEKLEKIDGKIQKKRISALLKGFLDDEVSGIIDFINEKSFEIQSEEDFLNLMQNEDELSLALSPETLKKIGALKNRPSLLKKIYQTLNAFTDEEKQHTRRVRKVTSLTKVDAVFSEFSRPEELKGFLSKKKIQSPESLRFLGYLLEQSLIKPQDLQNYFKSPDFIHDAGVFGFSEAEIRTFHQFAQNDIQALSLLLQNTPKQIKVSNLIDFDSLNKNPQLELFMIQKRLEAWSLYESALYSKDNPAVTLMMVEMFPQLLKEEREALIFEAENEIKTLLKDSEIKYYLSGEPVITSFMGQYMVRDLTVLFPMVILLMSGFLYLSFRHWRGVALPMITVVFSTVWTLGTIALMGKAISIVSTILPVLLVAVGSAYGIHMIHHYYEDRALGMDRETALKKTVKEIGGAVIMAGATTVAGFGSLAVNKVLPLKDFGIFAAIGVTYALMISMVLIPALLRLGKVPKKIADLHLQSEEDLEKPHGMVTRFLEKLGKSTLNRKKTYLAVFSLIFLGSLAGAKLLKVEINSIDYFKNSTEIKKADSFIQQNFAGTSTLNIVIDTKQKNGILNVDFLRKIETLQKEIEKDPMTGKATSAVDFVKKMHQTMNHGLKEFYAIPSEVYDSEGELKNLSAAEKKSALAAIALSYLDQFNRDDLRQTLNQDKSMIKVAVVLKTGSTLATEDLTQKISRLTQGLFTGGETIHFTGVNPLYLEVNSLIVDGQMWSVVSSIIMVLFLVALMLRSVLMGLIGIIPLGLAILINFGLMGILGIHLDAATAIVSNIAIGIGVDYTIHYLNGYLLLIKKGEGRQEASVHTSVRSGQAILINAVSVAAGFLILCFSSFIPLIHVGWLIALTMLTTSFSALTLVPVILNKMKLKKWQLQTEQKN